MRTLPPTESEASIISTSRFSRVRISAAAKPANPAPTITISGQESFKSLVLKPGHAALLVILSKNLSSLTLGNNVFESITDVYVGVEAVQSFFRIRSSHQVGENSGGG